MADESIFLLEPSTDSPLQRIAISMDTETEPNKVPQNLRDAYNQQIKAYKESLERVTIAKAKAETLGVLDYPLKDTREVLGWVI